MGEVEDESENTFIKNVIARSVLCDVAISLIGIGVS